MDEALDLRPAKTIPDATEQAGVGRYLWLYFFVVPLAAVSASTVAIIITALQGLESNALAPLLFSLIVQIGLKLIAAIAVAYVAAVVLAILLVFLVNKAKDSENEELSELKTIVEMTNAEHDNAKREYDKALQDPRYDRASYEKRYKEAKENHIASYGRLSRFKQMQSKHRDQTVIALSLFIGACGLWLIIHIFIWEALVKAWGVLEAIAVVPKL